MGYEDLSKEELVNKLHDLQKEYDSFKKETNDLKETILRLKEAVGIAKLGSWGYDVKTNTFIFTDEFYAIFNTTAEKEGGYVMHAETYAEKFVHPDDRHMVGIEIQKALTTPIPDFYTKVDHRIIDATGQIKYITVHYRIMKDKQGNILKHYGVNQDITDRKLIERELFLAKERAEESGRLKTAFLQNMSHEIRSPMNAIIGFSNLIPKNFDKKEKLKKFSTVITQRSKDLLDIINDILDVAKIESGQVSINEEECNLDELFKELTLFFSEYRERLGKENIGFSLHSHCLHKTIVTDPVKLKQILINLIVNAFKFTYRGKVEGGCRIENNKLAFYVSDTGIGIPKDKQKTVFERFAQVQHVCQKNVGGTGLGLPIVKGLVELLGGEVSLESELEKGSTFTFTLPLKTSKQGEKAPIATEIINSNIFSDKTILIVEDDPYNAEYLLEILSDKGMQIFYAEYGTKAVEMVISQPIDLVLMDVRLPDIGGYEATCQILKHKPRIKIIAQTSYASQDEKQKAIDAGCVDYISKPIKEDTLIAMISKHLAND